MHLQVAVFHRPSRPAPVALFSVSLGFSLLHVLTAAEVKRWATKRRGLGLEGSAWEVQTLASIAQQTRKDLPVPGTACHSESAVPRPA